MRLESERDPLAGRPVGDPVEVHAAKRPSAITLEGRFGAVERLSSQRHAPDLWDAVRSHNEIWAYLPYGPFSGFDALAAWLGERECLQDPFYFAITDKKGRAIGLASLIEMRPAMRVIEVGHIVYGAPLQRTHLATEAQYLLSRYVFEELGYRRYEWKCDALNAASRRAALRFGFTFEGVFRSHMIVKGRNRDTAWFSMLDTEWPARKHAFETWLACDNFDTGGRQRSRLSVWSETSR